MKLTKELLKKVMKGVTIWVILWLVLTGLFGSGYHNNILANILWEVAAVASLIFFAVILPLTISGKKEDDHTMHGMMVIDGNTDCDDDAEVTSKSTEEIAAIRTSMLADINSCMSSGQYMWQWANPYTISRLFIFNPCDSSDAGYGCLTVENSRVINIEMIPNKSHTPIFFPNMPLVEKERENKARIDSPVIDFLARSVPDAKWSWISAASGTIFIDSKERGIVHCSATLKFNPAGEITSINVHHKDGTSKRIMAKKVKSTPTRPQSKATKPAKPSASTKPMISPETSSKPIPTPETQQKPESCVETPEKASPQVSDEAAEDKAGPIVEEISKTKSEITAPEGEYTFDGTTEDWTLSEETKEHLLDTTDIPPISQADMERAAMLRADFDAQMLNELAMSAEENGEDNFTLKWPEGLQTKVEVETYCKYLLQRRVFVKAEVDAEKETIRFYLPDFDM